MILLPLNPGTYAGRKFTVRYQTNGYYEIEPSEQGFSMKYVPLEVPVEKSFEDEILGKWLEAPVAFGAFEGDVAKAVIHKAFENGLIVERVGRRDSVVKIMPELKVPMDTLEKGLNILAKSIREVVGELK